MLDFLNSVSGWVWGLPLIILLMGTGLLLTIRTGLLQVVRLPKALKFMMKNEKTGTGEVSSFQALCTALSATVGTGNIVGVATAIMLGGPGAMFWMWVAAFLGMATKYAEGLLAVKFRHVKPDGSILGGPFYYIEKGLGKNWKWLAKTFAFLGALAGLMGIGTITQVNGIASAVTNFFDPAAASTITLFGNSYTWATIITSIVVAILVALVVIGGLKRIASVSQIVVPIMVVIYVVAALIILVVNWRNIGPAFGEIFSGAFGAQPIVGGVAGGLIANMLNAMQRGVARGIFSNESGLGSAPIAAAAAKTNEPVRQGLVTMTGTFLDTIIVCTMTGLAIICTKSHTLGMEGVTVTANAFAEGMPFVSQVGNFILMVCLALFAFTTILGWDYYAERCFEYLTNGNKTGLQVFRWLYILAVFIGPFLTLAAVWTVADIFNGLMAFPNLVALVLLSGVVAKETKDYFRRAKEGLLEEY